MGLNGFGEASDKFHYRESFSARPLNRPLEVASRPLLGRFVVGRISRQVSVSKHYGVSRG